MRYRFEIGDLRAFLNVMNVMLIIRYGLTVAWFGLVVSTLGLLIDIMTLIRREPYFRINSCINHLATMILNLYFITTP